MIWRCEEKQQPANKNTESTSGLHYFPVSSLMFLVISLFTSVRHQYRDIYGLPQSRVLWLAGSSSWSSPHKKVRRRVTSFCSSGLGIGWERSRRGVSFGRIRGGWSKKLSKMSEKWEKVEKQFTWHIMPLFIIVIKFSIITLFDLLPPLSSVPGGGAQDAGGALLGPSL